MHLPGPGDVQHPCRIPAGPGQAPLCWLAPVEHVNVNAFPVKHIAPHCLLLPPSTSKPGQLSRVKGVPTAPSKRANMGLAPTHGANTTDPHSGPGVEPEGANEWRQRQTWADKRRRTENEGDGRQTKQEQATYSFAVPRFVRPP